MSAIDDFGPLRTRGRPSDPVEVAYVRDLEKVDLEFLALPRGHSPAPIKKLRDAHHMLARAMASGLSQVEAAAQTGYSTTRVNMLMQDPTFLDLVEVYRADVNAAFADMQARMASVSVSALEELRERLEEAPEGIDSTLLLDIVKVLADRTGHGPQTKSMNVNVNVDLAKRLEEAQRRVIDMQARGLPAPREVN